MIKEGLMPFDFSIDQALDMLHDKLIRQMQTDLILHAAYSVMDQVECKKPYCFWPL